MPITPEASVAIHRFGLGALATSPNAPAIGQPQDWLRQQLQPTRLDRRGLLPTTDEALKLIIQFQQSQKNGRLGLSPALDPQENVRRILRQTALTELAARWENAITTPTPFAERLVHFWGNHFTVGGAKPVVSVLQGPYERDALRPHLYGQFGDLLWHAVTHPGMLLYLDNAQSIGPESQAGMRQSKGLNENLAREILELHTLGVRSGYTQNDVSEFAKVLTGWTVAYRDASLPNGGHVKDAMVYSNRAQFLPRRHQPGSKTILGKTYASNGEHELEQVLQALARHPATARHIATKLARHFIADDPPEKVVKRLQKVYLDNQGDLTALYVAVLESPEAWRSDFPKLKTPEELAVSTYRLLGWQERYGAILTAVRDMGQAVGQTPSPAGWPDRAEEWLGPDAMWKRVEWASSAATRAAPNLDARQLAEAQFGSRLSNATRQGIARAESPKQALALLIASPEFQRR